MTTNTAATGGAACMRSIDVKRNTFLGRCECVTFGERVTGWWIKTGSLGELRLGVNAHDDDHAQVSRQRSRAEP
jgi:hypothetical protein